ncbi:hypothetical protein PVAND_000101 [Polypedilum vanderplanki]|uniref:C-type lectin domain-containing protein n=1 Tax=Polypedilum vanderplanki TaxID=319348 RepID=A0A9J6BJD1_POLVA|nr:hypothetical protein PVAND_000101 [Polypedilum vanderplanki]
MKLILLFTLCFASSIQLEAQENHPFEHIGTYEASNDNSTKEYFYSGDIYASWMKAMELCELFGMKLLTFDDAKEDENFRKSFVSFFANREAFIYIGANTTQPGSRTEWNWINGEKINFDIKWGEKQPDESSKEEFCLTFDENDPLVYHDMGCKDVLPFVCKESWKIKNIKVKE